MYKKLTEFLERYRGINPRRKWFIFKKYSGLLLSIPGLNTLNPNVELTLHSYLLGVMIVEDGILVAYTTYFYRNEPLNALQSISTLGVLIPNTALYIICIRCFKHFQRLLLFCDEQIYPHFRESPTYEKLCERIVNRLIQTTITDMGIMIVAMSIGFSLPAYYYLFKDKHLNFLPLVLPYVDIESTFGYYITQIHNMTFGAVATVAMAGIEICIEVLKNALWAQAEITSYYLDELNERMDQRTNNEFELKVRLRNIFVKINDSHRYMQEWADLFYARFFLQPFSQVFTVGLMLFLYIVDGWILGLFFSIFFYVTLFVLCKTGEEVQQASDHLLLKIYDCKWYEMSLRNQQLFVAMIHNRQNAIVIQMGPFSVLNYEKFTKMIYNFIMMLVNVVKT